MSSSPLDGVQLHLVDTVDEAMEFMRWLGERRDVLAIDTETSGLMEHHGDLRLVQFGDYGAGWSIPWERWGGVVVEALRKYTGQIVFHNAAFDVRWMELHIPGWQAPWERLDDTMIMAQVDDSTRPAALKWLSDRFIDRRASQGQALLKIAMEKQGWDWGSVPVDFDIYWQYGALDCVITALLWKYFRPIVNPVSYDLEMATRKICSKMEQRGARVDLEYSREQSTKLHAYADSVQDWGKKTYGMSLSSPIQVTRLFQDRLQAPITETTPKGAPSANKLQLQLFIAEYGGTEVAQVAQTILNMRKADKLAGSYFDGFDKWNIDGVVHPQIRSMGARTRRMSITQPALQTLKRGDPIVRDAFIPFAGEGIITCDYSQIEARLFAHFSADENLCNAFGGPEDFFVVITRQIFKDQTIQKDDKRRSLVKNAIYALLYGAGIIKMAATAGVPQAHMQVVIDGLNALYPGIQRFIAQNSALVGEMKHNGERPYTTTVFGSKLYVDEERPYSATNYAIQGSAAEIFKRAMLRCDAADLTRFLVVPVHDELVLSVPKEDIPDVRHALQQAMEVTDGEFRVPLTADPEGGESGFSSWGSKYRTKEEQAKRAHEQSITDGDDYFSGDE